MMNVWWWFLPAAVGVLIVTAWAWRRGKRRWAMLSAALALMACVAGGMFIERPAKEPTDRPLSQSLPRLAPGGEFATSANCQSCHPQEYASWHASYHRQMTQPATDAAVKASFNGEEFDVGENRVRLSRRGDEFWVELLGAPPAPGRPRQKLRETRVVMTTGSHHMQGFWVARGTGNLLDQLPLMWLVADQETPGHWLPTGDSFLRPPEPRGETPWNANCIFCHSVFGKPRLDLAARNADTEVVELGIACEACHGGAKEHEMRHREAAKTATADAARTQKDDSIVQPARLSPERSAQVCGHCHAVAAFTDDAVARRWNESGSGYRPGDDLRKHRLTLSPSQLSEERLAELKKDESNLWESNFWPDGMVRVAGREYNGLIESACYVQGGMTCLSCHSMHHSDPVDQLAAGRKTNEACYACHDAYRERLNEHTHHEPGSSGGLCYNCHMPHTTFGLFKAIRSHQISSPSLAATLETGRPNACNLCHLDQTLEWTGEKLSQWYGQAPAELSDDQRRRAASVLWLLSGDAVQRAILAWSCGWPEAREASGEQWLPPVLSPLLDDPYSAVRMIAGRSLTRLGYGRGYDFLAPRQKRLAVSREILRQWTSKPHTLKSQAAKVDAAQPQAAELASPGRVLLDDQGRLLLDELERLLQARDDHPVTIRE